MESAPNPTPATFKTSHYKVEYAVWHHIKADTVWSSFAEFMQTCGPRPSKKHRFRRPNKAAPFGPGNGGWHFTHPAVPLADFHALPDANLEGTSSGPFNVRGYHGHGLWNMTCRACNTEQIRPPETACLACGASNGLTTNELPPMQTIRDKKARNARFNYARTQLKSPTRHRSNEAYNEFWQNLPEGKPAQMDYVLKYWGSL